MLVRTGEEWFSMNIDVVRPVMKVANQASAISVIPISCRRLMSISWLIESKAAYKSFRASIEPYLLSRLKSRSLVIFVNAVSMGILACTQIRVNKINCMMLQSLLRRRVR